VPLDATPLALRGCLRTVLSPLPGGFVGTLKSPDLLPYPTFRQGEATSVCGFARDARRDAIARDT